MTAAERYPELRQFLGGYFHEDSGERGDSWEAVVDSYVQERSRPRQIQALEELETLLAVADDEAVERSVDELGVAYLPDPLTARQWLSAVQRRLAVAVDA